MTMHKLLKDSNIRTVPALPEKPQAQELLSALRGLRLDERFINPLQSNIIDDTQKGGLQIRIEEVQMPVDDARRRTPAHSPSAQSPLEHSSKSPIQPSMFMPYFAPAQHHATGQTSFPTSSQSSFSPVSYPGFEYRQPMQQPQLIAHHQTHGLHPAVAAGHTFQGGVMALQQPWRQQTNSLSPGTGTPLGGLSNQPTPVDSSPRPFPGSENRDEGPPLQPAWPWSCELDLAYYASHGGNAHDSSIGLELEAIEQRGDIVMPHDSHTP